jgi:hypothetical protein
MRPERAAREVPGLIKGLVREVDAVERVVNAPGFRKRTCEWFHEPGLPAWRKQVAAWAKQKVKPPQTPSSMPLPAKKATP